LPPTKAWLNPECSVYFRLIETLYPRNDGLPGERIKGESEQAGAVEE
jgi:hypothetical protein